MTPRRELRRLPQTFRYLIAYTLYNDGIQTIISTASVFLAQELFVARGLPTNESFLIGLVLMIQLVAFSGALPWPAGPQSRPRWRLTLHDFSHTRLPSTRSSVGSLPSASPRNGRRPSCNLPVCPLHYLA